MTTRSQYISILNNEMTLTDDSRRILLAFFDEIATDPIPVWTAHGMTRDQAQMITLENLPAFLIEAIQLANQHFGREGHSSLDAITLLRVIAGHGDQLLALCPLECDE